MNHKIRRITETSVLLALLITLQALTKGFGQLVTGSCVNAILAVATLFCGLPSGITIALISPVLAFLLGIAPQVLTVPAIMVGNAVYVAALFFLSDPSKAFSLRQIFAWAAAAFAKFTVLYYVVVEIYCGTMALSLMEAGTLKPPMIAVLSATFSWPQLITALIGGGLAMCITPVLHKALHR